MMDEQLNKTGNNADNICNQKCNQYRKRVAWARWQYAGKYVILWG
jgi:hypothetical protein